MAKQAQLPFVLFHVKECMYAVPSTYVREILILPEVVPIPNVPPEVRGVINLRGKITKIIDLRARLGLPPITHETDQLIQLLCDREQDHRNWLDELVRCVKERRSFTLARDPHKCKFGVWYDQFKTENSLLRMTLKNMEAPHRAIHESASEILRLAESGNIEAAEAMIEERKHRELASLINLFEQARQLLRERQSELALVLANETARFALTIDNVEAVEHIPENLIEPMPASMASLKSRIAKRPKTQQTIILLEEPFLFPSGAAFLEPAAV